MNYFRLLGIMLLLWTGAYAQPTPTPAYEAKWKSYKNSTGDSRLALADTNRWGAATSKNRMLPSQNEGTIVYALHQLSARFAFGFNKRSNDNEATTQLSTYLENIDYGLVYDNHTLYSKDAEGIKAIALGIDTERSLTIRYNRTSGKVTYYMNGEQIATASYYSTDTLHLTAVLRPSFTLNSLVCDFSYPLEVHLAKHHASAGNPSSGMLMGLAEGGLPPYRFRYAETGSTEASQFGLQPGTYHVVVKDSLNDSLLVSADLGFLNSWYLLRNLALTDSGYVKTGTNPDKAGAAIAQHRIPEYTNGFCEVTVTESTQDLAFGFLGFGQNEQVEGYQRPLIREGAVDSLLVYADSLLTRGFTAPALPKIAEAYQRLNLAYFKDGIVHIGFKDFSVSSPGAITYQAGDVFKIERTGNTISLFKNSILLASNTISGNDAQFLLSGILQRKGTGLVRESASFNGHDGITATLAPDPLCDGPQLNWVKTKTFDENGLLKSESMSYMDNLGRTIQSQVKQLSSGNALVSEPLFDSWGRAVGQSLAAPSFEQELCYVPRFIERSSATAYAPTDFDNLPGTGLSGDILDAFNALGDVNHPKSVYSGNPGKLGWYYSNNNSAEPLVAADALPYARVEYSDNGRIRRSAGAGSQLGMGSGHETYMVYTSTPEATEDPASNELNYLFPYGTYQLEKTFNVEPSAAIHNLQLFKTISINPDGRDQISYSNAAGQTIATCITGDGTGCVSHLEKKVLYPQHSRDILQNIYVPAARSGTLRFSEEGYPSMSYTTAVVPSLKDLLNNVVLVSGTDYTYNATTGYFTFTGNYAGRSLYLQLSYSGTVTPGRWLVATAETDYTQWTLYFYDRKGRLLGNTSPAETVCQTLPAMVQRSLVQGSPGFASSANPIASLDFNEAMKQGTRTTAYLSIGELFSPISSVSSPSPAIYPLKSASVKYLEDSLYFAGDVLPKDSLFIDGLDTTRLPAFTFPTDPALAMYRLIDSLETQVPVNALRGKEIHFTGEYAIYGKLSKGGLSAEPLATMPYDFRVSGDGSSDGNGAAIIKGYSNNPPILVKLPLDELEEPLDGVVITIRNTKGELSGFGGDGTDVSGGLPVWVPQPLEPILGTIGQAVSPGIKLGGIQHPLPITVSLANRYMYDEYDRLVGSINEDQGTVYYVYDQKEDKLLFTQNQKQRDEGGKFSCIVYDKLARPVVSGEYDPGNGGPTSGDVPYLFQDYYTWKAGTPVPAGRISTGAAALANSDGYNDGHIFERTFIAYDDADATLPATIGSSPMLYRQRYTDAKVSKTWNDHTTTWYSYDELGRQTWSVQQSNALGYKTLNYTYDFRGKLLASAYQLGESDNLVHRYTYDADERLHTALYGLFVGGNPNDYVEYPLASYEYYLHGPLKRTELGNRIQGLDYVYTIDGKLKAVNNPLNNGTDKDPGFDGYATGPHAPVSRDAFAYALEYYPHDYERSGSTIRSHDHVDAYSHNLSYAGVVKAQSWRTTLPAGAPASYTSGLMYEYQYDEQYRLTGATFGSITETPALPGGAPIHATTFTQKPEYKLENIDYDKNGNLQHLKRYAAPINSSTAHLLDNLTYHYHGTAKNKLARVSDLAVNTASYSAGLDLPNQTNISNYVYNSLGELEANLQEDRGYAYNASGLVTRVYNISTNHPVAEYLYNDKGLKYRQTEYVSGIGVKETYYIYDAGGVQVATYTQDLTTPAPMVVLQNHSLYGAGRVGLLDKSTGKTLYELSDHLGNVRAVISDQKIASGSVCKSCGDLQTVYQGFVGSHGALNASNLPAFVTYANASFSVSNTQSTYLQALTDCKLISTTIDFAGAGYVASTSSNSLNLGTGNVSIETWFKCDNTDSYKVLIDNVEWGTVLRGIQAYIYEDKLYACFMEGNAHSSWHVYTNNSIPVNQWTHVVITKTGYNPAAYAIYINGVAVSVTQAPPATSTGAAGMNNTLPLNLGMNVYAGSPSSLYEGRLRNMKVYSKALSPSEIATNYNGGCMTAATVTANLVYYAKLDEGTGTTANDYSGGNLTSTITNAGWTMEGMPANSCLSPAEQSQQLCYFGATTYIAEVIETHDYYPSGLVLPGRNYTSSLNFPYGYQGQEKDQATGLTNFELRQYDPRISRWYNPDPYGQHHSPYLAMSNNPVSFTDPDGGWDGDSGYKNGIAGTDDRNKNDFLAQSFGASGQPYNWMATSPADRQMMQKFYGTSYGAQESNRRLDNGALGGWKSPDGTVYHLVDNQWGYYENSVYQTQHTGLLNEVFLTRTVNEFINVQTISLYILHGSSQSWGGIRGGHVGVRIGDNVYGFTNTMHGGHLFGRMDMMKRNSVFEKDNVNDPGRFNTNSDLNTTVFEIPVSNKTYQDLKDTYEKYVASTKYTPDHPKGKKSYSTPYDYAQFFGKRCASSAYSMLVGSGAFKDRKILNGLISVNPGSLYRYTKSMGLPSRTNYKGGRVDEKGKPIQTNSYSPNVMDRIFGGLYGN